MGGGRALELSSTWQPRPGVFELEREQDIAASVVVSKSHLRRSIAQRTGVETVPGGARMMETVAPGKRSGTLYPIPSFGRGSVYC